MAAPHSVFNSALDNDADVGRVAERPAVLANHSSVMSTIGLSAAPPPEPLPPPPFLVGQLRARWSPPQMKQDLAPSPPLVFSWPAAYSSFWRRLSIEELVSSAAFTFEFAVAIAVRSSFSSAESPAPPLRPMLRRIRSVSSSFGMPRPA